jgi:hypothetical protein
VIAATSTISHPASVSRVVSQGRITVAPLQFDGDLHHLAQHFAQTIRAVGLRGPCLHQLLDVTAHYGNGALVAVTMTVRVGLAAEALDDVAIYALRNRLECFEGGAVVIRDCQR